MTDAIRDNNHRPVLIGTSYVDGVTPVPIALDASNQMLVDKTSHASDLVGHWKFDEAAGTTADDSSLSELDGTIIADNVTLDGSDFTFDNVDVEYKVRATGTVDKFESGDMTWSTWITPTNVLASQYIWCKYNVRFSLNGSNHVRFACGRMTDSGGPTYDTDAILAMENDTEYHLVGQYHPDPVGGNGYINLYVDGVLQDTKNIGALEIWTGYGNKDLQWGNSNHGSAVPYEGKIRESRIYKRLLTETEIGELYANDTAVITPVTASLTGNASRDNNHVPVMMAVDSTDATKKLPVYVNPDTGAVLIETN